MSNSQKLKRITTMSYPKKNIYIGVLFSTLEGLVMPLFGIFIGRALFILSGYYSQGDINYDIQHHANL